MEEKAKQLLQEMERQLTHYNEQVLMTQAAIQVLQLLLADSEERDHVQNDTADHEPGGQRLPNQSA